jgi:hypothetical protein
MQGIFVNFKNVQQTARSKVPFGIAQVGEFTQPPPPSTQPTHPTLLSPSLPTPPTQIRQKDGESSLPFPPCRPLILLAPPLQTHIQK